MSETGGRAVGEGGHNPKGAVEAAAARYRWSHIPGEPDALKGACPVRRGTVGKGSRSFLDTSLAVYPGGREKVGRKGQKKTEEQPSGKVPLLTQESPRHKESSVF